MLLALVTISLDGYMAGPGITKDTPMGVNGSRLHEWIRDPTPADREFISDISATVGAVVLGRRTFDIGLDQWNDTPYPAPSFVVTHRPHEPLHMSSATFTFVDDVNKAVVRARAAAGDKHVVLMGADITQQALASGLIDELRLQLAPITLGSGIRLFTGTKRHTFEPLGAHQTPHVTHLRYRTKAAATPASRGRHR